MEYERNQWDFSLSVDVTRETNEMSLPWKLPEKPMGFLVVRGRYQRNQWDFSLLRSIDITKESNRIFLCYSPCTVAEEPIVTLHQLF